MGEVHITSTEFIQPARAAHSPPKFKLTAFDRIMRYIPYQERVLFYKHHQVPFEEVVTQLKTSLENVLSIFHPFAGRIQVTSVTSSSSYLELDCGAGKSVKFTQAITHATLDKLDDLLPSDFCDSLCGLSSPPPEYPWSHEDPLLFIQVTKFSCGGFSLGFSFSHQLVDGTSAWHFMASWAEMARTGSVSVPPDIKFEFEEEQHIAAIRAALQSGASNFGEGALRETSEKREGKQVLLSKKFKLDKELIQKLKSDGAAACNGTRFSTFVVAAAYVWTKIRRLSHFEACNLVYPYNCRERTSISKTYFGNAVAAYQATVKVKDVVGAEDMWVCATTLHESIAELDSGTALSIVAYLDWQHATHEQNSLQAPERIVHVVESPRQPVYEADFGFGKPVGATFGTSNTDDGMLFMFPSAEDGCVEATVSLNQNAMDQLVKQED